MSAARIAVPRSNDYIRRESPLGEGQEAMRRPGAGYRAGPSGADAGLRAKEDTLQEADS